MTRHLFDLTVLKVTMELNGRTLVCSDGSNTASYYISVKDYEPTLIEDRNSGSIKATSGCMSPDTDVSFKWIKIYASSNVETEFNPKRIVKSNTSCTNDSDCGNSMQVHFSETIAANASAEGNYYLKVTAMYGNESKESFSSGYSGQKYIIEEQDKEQSNSDRYYVVVVVFVVFAVAATLNLLALTVFFNRIYFHRQRLSERGDTEENTMSTCWYFYITFDFYSRFYHSRNNYS
ncbi:uncharacterized protein LOC132751553 [Ruditapes philippinarum]|uniref:uncharacterized protein LOC132751553 n=1 Tax=Ruditapes philippinarum TaxID=129788 RepID=UPI00295C31B4|nr:uncharacterized protein LOC132751553 [Ruditapes philippinarum]